MEFAKREAKRSKKGTKQNVLESSSQKKGLINVVVLLS